MKNKTKAELLEIITELEKRLDQSKKSNKKKTVAMNKIQSRKDLEINQLRSELKQEKASRWSYRLKKFLCKKLVITVVKHEK